MTEVHRQSTSSKMRTLNVLQQCLSWSFLVQHFLNNCTQKPHSHSTQLLFNVTILDLHIYISYHPHTRPSCQLFILSNPAWKDVCCKTKVVLESFSLEEFEHFTLIIFESKICNLTLVNLYLRVQTAIIFVIVLFIETVYVYCFQLHTLFCFHIANAISAFHYPFVTLIGNSVDSISEIECDWGQAINCQLVCCVTILFAGCHRK